MRNSLAGIALSVLVVLAVVLGLLLSGGPGMGRKEKRDEIRGEDLLALARQVRCLAGAASGQIPETIINTEPCDLPRSRTELRFADPFSGAPYRYEIVDVTRFRFCAELEAPERFELRAMGMFDRVSGCITFQTFR